MSLHAKLELLFQTRLDENRLKEYKRLSLHENLQNYPLLKFTNSPPPVLLTSFDFSPSINASTGSYMESYLADSTLRDDDSSHVARVVDAMFIKFVSDPKNRDSNYVDVKFADTFHGARRALQFLKTPAEIFKYYFTLAKICPLQTADIILNTSLQYVIPFFSYLKRYIHTHFDSLPPIAYAYSELDTIAGYPSPEHRAQSDNATEWLQKDVDDQHTPHWWAQQIINLFVRNYRRSTRKFLSFNQFVGSPWLWVTDGASRESLLHLGGKRVRSKLGAALSLTTDELLLSVLNAIKPNSVNMSIFIKQDERGFKRRLIANLDLGSYLVAAYVRYLIEYIQGPVPRWMTATTTPTTDTQVFHLLRLCRRAIPLDESAFDHHVSHAAWLGFLQAMKFFYPENVGLLLFEILFNNTKFLDPDSGKIGMWYKGMPSGLAITAIGNTIFNVIKQERIFSPVHWALGDDALLFNEKITLHAIEQYYNTYGAEVNAKKNWESRKYCEYLHFLYWSHGRIGYPARIYGSLMYAIQFKDNTPLTRLAEVSTLFKDFYDRALLPFDETLVAADLSRAVSRKWKGFSTQVARTWLHIPRAVNGFGFLPYTYAVFQVKTTKFETQKYENSLYPLKDVKVPRVTEYRILPFHFKDASYYVGPGASLPPVETMEQWIERLNLDEKLGDLKMDTLGTIPLPVINYVSINKMSDFARKWQFNVLPNMRGDRIKVTNRLITASIALCAQVREWMSENQIYVYV